MQSAGIDLVEIPRMEKSLQSSRFLEKVYGPAEREELARKQGRRFTESAAAAFAAKEAFSKALGTGIKGFALSEVQLLHDGAGAPFLQLSGRAAALACQRGFRFTVSVTHTAAYAAAVVIGYTA